MDPDLRREVLSRIDRRENRTPLSLYLLGLAFVVVAIVGIAGGADKLPGFLPHLTRLCLGMLFLYVGALIQERQRLGNAFRELLESFEAFNQSIYGKDYKVQRRAIDILITTLRADDASVREKVHSQLVRLTGQQMPPEPEAWERWWADNKATFASRSGAGRGGRP